MLPASFVFASWYVVARSFVLTTPFIFVTRAAVAVVSAVARCVILLEVVSFNVWVLLSLAV